MGLETFFEVPEDARNDFISREILAHVPEKEHVHARATEIVTDYAGLEISVLSILAFAAQENRFEEFAKRLKDYYSSSSLPRIPPRNRRYPDFPGTRTFDLFADCFRDLGVPLGRNPFYDEYFRTHYEALERT